MIIYLIVFLVGLVFGSFLNVLIHRLPLAISLVKPIGSKCPNCNHGIKWYENIPIFSYLALKGKCSDCSKPISIVYPIVEITTAVVTLMLFMNTWFSLELVLSIALFYTLIVLSCFYAWQCSKPIFLNVYLLCPPIIMINTTGPKIYRTLLTMIMCNNCKQYIETLVLPYQI